MYDSKTKETESLRGAKAACDPTCVKEVGEERRCVCVYVRERERDCSKLIH
jgi:hypothetical protein